MTSAAWPPYKIYDGEKIKRNDFLNYEYQAPTV